MLIYIYVYVYILYINLYIYIYIYVNIYIYSRLVFPIGRQLAAIPRGGAARAALQTVPAACSHSLHGGLSRFGHHLALLRSRFPRGTDRLNCIQVLHIHILSKFGILGWIQNGYDITNAFVNCEFHRFLRFRLFLKKCVDIPVYRALFYTVIG